MHLPLVLFDYDGVLINTFLEALETNADIGIAVTADEYRGWFAGNIFESIKAVPKARDMDTGNRYARAYHKRTHVMGVHPSMAYLIRELSKKYLLCIVSSGSERTIKAQLMNSHILDCFVDVLGYETDTSKVRKIKSALEMYHVGREKSVFVTDTLGDIKEAHHVGIHTIAVTWGFHTQEMLREGKPESIVQTPQELQDKIESLF
jgi:phosphoglycolate phosphatase